MKMTQMFYGLSVVLLLILMGGKSAIATDVNGRSLQPGRFTLSWSGGLEYGSRQLNFDGESKFYFAKGDAISSSEQTGVDVA